MQPIGDYLKKLLYQYNCIVVPTLGAFLTHTVSASFNEATGQFLPPRRKVAFNEALRLDDGILLNYVMLHEGISREEALNGINTFVATLKQQASQMGSFSIEGLGLFSYNAENSLQFDPELRHNFLGNAYGMQPIMLAHKVVHLAQPVAAVKAMQPEAPVRQLPVVVSDKSTALAPVTEEEGEVLPMPVRRSAAGWRWAAAALLVGSLGFVSYFSVINPGAPLQSSLNPASLFHLPAFLRAESSKEEVAAPPVTHKSVVPTPIAEPVPTPVAPAVTEVKAPEIAAKAIVVPTKAGVRNRNLARVSVPESVVSKQVRVKTKFTVIAGSFASRRNAIRFQRRLVRAGYDDAYIIRGRGLIKVAAIGAETLEEAQAGVGALNALTGITPFIKHN